MTKIFSPSTTNVVRNNALRFDSLYAICFHLSVVRLGRIGGSSINVIHVNRQTGQRLTVSNQLPVGVENRPGRLKH